jgi:hypothetical protein
MSGLCPTLSYSSLGSLSFPTHYSLHFNPFPHIFEYVKGAHTCMVNVPILPALAGVRVLYPSLFTLACFFSSTHILKIYKRLSYMCGSCLYPSCSS